MSRFILSAVQGKSPLCYFQVLPYHKGMPQRATLHVWFGRVYSGCSSWHNLLLEPNRGSFTWTEFQTTDILGSLMCWWCSSEHCSLKHCCIFSLAQVANKAVHSHCNSMTGLLLWCGWDLNCSVALPSFRGHSHHLAAASNVRNCIGILG